MEGEQLKKEDTKKEPTEPQEDSSKKQIDLQRLYVKEQQCKLSRSPQIFKEEWKPEVNMEMQINNSMLDKDLYEATLQINITVKNKQITVFTAEVQQAGIFLVKGFSKQEQKAIFTTYVPNTLYPYVRKIISSLSVEATIPPITLMPINFDTLYRQQLAETNKPEKSEKLEQAKSTVLPQEATALN